MNARLARPHVPVLRRSLRAAYALLVGTLLASALHVITRPSTASPKSQSPAPEMTLPPHAVARMGKPSVPAKETAARRARPSVLPPNSILFAPADQTLITAKDGLLEYWNARMGKRERHISTDDIRQPVMAISPDGSLLAIGGHAAHHLFLRLSDGKCVRQSSRFHDIIANLSFTPDGQHLVMTGHWGKVMWESVDDRGAKGKEDTTGEGSLALSADGRRLVSGVLYNTGAGAPFSVWNLGPVGQLNLVGDPDDRIGKPADYVQNEHVALSSDGRTLATASRAPGTVLFWNVKTGSIAKRYVSHDSDVGPMCFSPDNKTLALGTTSGNVHVIETFTGKGRGVFAGHLGAVTCLMFSHDGTRLASGSDDGTSIVWDVTGLDGNKQGSAGH